MLKYLIIIFSFLILIISCQSPEQNTSYLETVEIYSIKGDKNNAEKGSLVYKEETRYKGPDRPEWRKFFEKTGEFKAIEKYSYHKDGDLPTSSDYYDADDTLLSKYIFTNEDGKQTRNVGLEGTSNEVLRIEESSYDENGNRVQKIIKEASGTIDRVYRFGFDKDGNEVSMTVADKAGTINFTETYTITKKNDKGQWTEAWGFRNDQPTIVKYRTIQ